MSLWFALGPGAEARLHAYAYDYLRIHGDRAARAMAGVTRVSSAGALREAFDAIEAVGCDELLLVPTTVDPTELDRVIDAIG